MKPGPSLVRIRAHDLERVVGGARPLNIGRDRACDIVLHNAQVSRLHAVLRFGPAEGWVLEDAGSSGGTYVDGSRVGKVPVVTDTVVWLGHPVTGARVELALLAPLGALAATLPLVDRGDLVSIHDVERDLRIGRASDNDIVVADLLASRHHAELHANGRGQWSIVDLDSHNGTFLNGRRIRRAPIGEGGIVAVGRHSFRLTDGRLEEYLDRGGMTLAVVRLTVRTPERKVILNNLSFELPASSMLAVVGPTGAGKSTFAKALTGFRPADAGSVLYGGRDLYASFDELRTRIGYVPQEDILHQELSVVRALEFGAELRFPTDVPVADRRRRVHEVMGELGLTERSDVAIHKLSGGERKRTSVALELLSKPSLLLLDEPTSGLDPGYEKGVMQLLSRLARDGRTVVVVTHSLQSLELCDRVMFLAPGGRLAFFGKPQSALGYFGHDNYADVFQELSSDRSRDWTSEFGQHLSGVHGLHTEPGGDRAEPEAPAEAAAADGRSLEEWQKQVSTLVRRQLAILGSDRRTAVFLAIGVLLPGLAILALVGPGALNQRAGVPSRDARTLLSALVIAGASIGAANALREIVKEGPIYQRERAIGVSISAYVVSKLLVIGAITVGQVVLLVGLATARANGPQAGVILPGRIELVLDVALAALTAMALGLLISALVSSSEKAMALIAVIFIVQWLFSGAAVELRGKPVLQGVGYLTSANWGLAAAASTADLHALERQGCGAGGRASPHGSSASSCDRRWTSDFIHWFSDGAALVVLTGATSAGVWFVLVRRDQQLQPQAAGRRSLRTGPQT